VIRKYDPADLNELLDVWYHAAKIAHPFWTGDMFEQERRDITREFLPIAETWVFEREGHVVGFIALLDKEVGGIFVAPTQQGQGVGRALMDNARASRDYLELDVFEANEVGRTFYDAYGFTVVGNRLDEKTGLRVLRLRLDC
jgi:putative acetyltransferase